MQGLPWFSMFSGRWLASSSIAQMNPTQEGGYIHLLMHAWEDKDCGLPDDDEALAKLSRLGEEWLNGGCQVVRDCFVPHPTIPGKIISPLQFEQRQSSIDWQEKSSKGGGRVR